MKILQIMFFSGDKVLEYVDAGHEHQLHNIYGYDRFRNMDGISVTCLFPNLNFKFYNSFPKIKRVILEFRLIKLQIKCALISKNYDVIYSPFDFHLLPLAILRMLRICRKPIFSISHFAYNSDLIEKRMTNSYRMCERFFVYRGVDRISFLNDNLLKLARRGSSLPNRHSTSVNWGANLNFFQDYVKEQKVPPEAKYFISIGSQNRDYNTLVKAFSKLPAHLKIFGKMDEASRFSGTIPKNVEFDKSVRPGLNSVGELRHFYYNAIAVLIPISRITDISNGASVIVEALAMGKPIIITDFSVNYIDVELEGVGIKVGVGDVDAWIKTIQWLIDHPREVSKMGARALELARTKYNYDSFTNHVLSHLTDLVGK